MKKKRDLKTITANNLSIEPKPYVLIIGETPSKGARSPKLWNKVYKNFNKSIKMYPADVKPKLLKILVNFLNKDKFFLGSAVTTPYKEEIMKFLDEYDLNVKNIGSVNTIKRAKNKLVGFNTDYFGVLNSLDKYKGKKRILIFGCGGAGKATIAACFKKFKNSYFYLYNRDKIKLNKFIKKIKLKNFQIINNSELLALDNIDLVLNTTSIGFNSWILKGSKYYNLMYFTPFQNLQNVKGVKQIDKQKFVRINRKLINQDNENCSNFFKLNKKCDIFDIIYNPNKTKLLKIAKKNGNKIQNGLQMNLYQAVKGFSIVNNINNDYKIRKTMSKNG